MKSNLQTIILGLASSIVGMIIFTTINTWADADNNPATDNLARVVPYEGTIEVDGGTFTGNLSMRFTLYDDGDNPLWIETYSTNGDSGENVNVYAGRFSVLLGKHVDLTSTVLDAEAIFVGVDISTDDFETSTALSGRQQLGMSPFAMWAMQSTNLHVANTLTVDSTSTLTGNVGIGTSPGEAQLSFPNTGGEGGFDDYSDYKIMLWKANTPQGSYGLGIESATLAFNSGREYDFNVEGATMLNINNSNNSTLTMNGSIKTGTNTVQGDILNRSPNGQLGVSSGFVFRDSGDTWLRLNNGNGSNTYADLAVGNHYVSGDLTVNGDITNLTVSEIYSVIAEGNGGLSVASTDMVPVGNSLCFLMTVELEDLDSSGENGGCAIYNSNGTYRLQAYLRDGPDGSAYCNAACLTW